MKKKLLPRFSFYPRFFDAIKTYRLETFWGDLGAGITVGVVALPLAMAFAIASGMKPEAGIYTAVIAGFLVSLLGGSPVQIGGPAGAFIVVVYGIIGKYGVDGLIISTILAGILLFLMGMMRLGSLIRYVPVAIVTGFTNGIALLIILSQIKDLLGLKITNLPSDFLPKIVALANNLSSFDGITAALALASAAVVFGWPALARMTGITFLQRIPGSLLALAGGTAAVAVLGLDVETIGTRFGGIPSSLPDFTFPHISLDLIQNLLPPTLTIALLGAIESLLCARVADGIIGDRHDPNQELMAQGVANVAAPLFGGYCATGTIARTVTNIRSGGKTPVAGMIHALTLLVIILAAAPLARDVPLATLGTILLYVAYNMGEWHEFVRLKNFSNNYRVILLSTFVLTVAIDLTVAVEIGLALSFFFFVTRVSSLTRLEPFPLVEAGDHARLGKEIEAYRLYGSLFFGSVDKLEELSDPKRPMPKVLVLSLTNLLNIDSSGLEALENLHDTLAKKGSRLVIVGAQAQPLSLMTRAGFMKKIGRKNIFDSTAQALDALTGDKPAPPPVVQG
ncbi:MAG: SulP family inorganic anion transporter [Bdellovibrionales bacterium]